MAYREKPILNRYCELRETEKAYKKHLQAVASAKSVVDTSPPVAPKRLKCQERQTELFRKKLTNGQEEHLRLVRGDDPIIKDLERLNHHLFPTSRYDFEDDSSEEMETSVKIGYSKEPIIEDVPASSPKKYLNSKDLQSPRRSKPNNQNTLQNKVIPNNSINKKKQPTFAFATSNEPDDFSDDFIDSSPESTQDSILKPTKLLKKKIHETFDDFDD